MDEHIEYIQNTLNTEIITNSQLTARLHSLVARKRELEDHQHDLCHKINQHLLRINRDAQRISAMVNRISEVIPQNLTKYDAMLKREPLMKNTTAFTYIINNPEQFPAVSELIAEIEKKQSTMRMKYEEESRTLKIQISLAEIELKQLLNRKKK